jgi:phytoene dehydrogenase-like protein
MLDAVVVGSGPNGLAAAITLAEAGRSVVVIEGAEEPGGGVRSAQLTLPGFVHDTCASVYPLGFASPFFKKLPLERYGVKWVHPRFEMAHPLERGAVLLDRSLDATAGALGKDRAAYMRLFGPLVSDPSWMDLLGPFRIPERPVGALRFLMRAALPASFVAKRLFWCEPARALLAGIAAHTEQPLSRPLTMGATIVLGALGHISGWPFVRGGSARLAQALVQHFRSLNGEVRTNDWVQTVDDLPAARVVLCDVTPRQLLRIAGHHLPDWYRRKLARFRYAPGVFKVDWALDRPIPWRSAWSAGAGTVHIGGTFDEIASAMAAVWTGTPASRPFLILAQPSLFDPTRAPDGKHTAWAYCRVPHGSTADMTEAIESQVERFAPGFRQTILGRHAMGPADLERHNPNLVGGDIGGGVLDFGQLFARPTSSAYSTPLPNLFLCSSSTPPGGGVHGLCGYFAARAALARLARG